MSSLRSPPRDQRRGARYRQRLAVELHTQRGSKELFTHDVGAHGLFLLMSEPPRERHVLKLTVHLPDGPVGIVAHGTHTSARGIGVQFFALSGDAKRRWNVYLGGLAGAPVDEAADPVFGDATFVVKMHSPTALREFADSCFDAGGTYLRTPVLKGVGSGVTVTMVHPYTEREFPLAGAVMRLHQQRPKGMEIRFSDATLARREAFHRFVETGAAPVFEIDLDTEEGLVVVEDSAAADEVGFDIDVAVLDDSEVVEIELDEEEMFSWHDVEDDLLLDTGIGDEELVPGRTDAELFSVGPLPFSQEGEPVPDDLRALTRPPFAVRLSCDSCDMLETELDAGGVPGSLGFVAEYKPFFCPSCRLVLTRRRLLLEEERQAALGRIKLRGALQAPTTLRAVFDVAELSDPPRCSSCEGKLKATRPVQLLAEVLAKLERGDDTSDVSVPCALCKDGRWRVERVAPPLKVPASQV